MTTTAAPQITFPITAAAGSVAIDLHAGVDCYSIVTTDSGHRLDAWSSNDYPKTAAGLRTALAEASRTLAAFTAHQSEVGIDRHRQQLSIQLQQARSRAAKSRTPWIYDRDITDLTGELTAVEDLTTRRLIADANRAA